MMALTVVFGIDAVLVGGILLVIVVRPRPPVLPGLLAFSELQPQLLARRRQRLEVVEADLRVCNYV
jgi:hypothetical protein